MRNLHDEEDFHDYSPNELAELSRTNPEKHDQIIQSNLEPGDTIEKWQQRNTEWVQSGLMNHWTSKS